MSDCFISSVRVTLASEWHFLAVRTCWCNDWSCKPTFGTQQKTNCRKGIILICRYGSSRPSGEFPWNDECTCYRLFV